MNGTDTVTKDVQLRAGKLAARVIPALSSKLPNLGLSGKQRKTPFVPAGCSAGHQRVRIQVLHSYSHQKQHECTLPHHRRSFSHISKVLILLHCCHPVNTFSCITRCALEFDQLLITPAGSCTGISSLGQGTPRPPSSQRDTGSPGGWSASHMTHEHLGT